MISQTCKYALRAATLMARRGASGPTLARDIAAEMGIPLNYLHKILRVLVREEILTSARGGKGGFLLKRPPKSITLMMLLRPFDENLRVPVCPFDNPQCGVANPCPMHFRWVHIVESYTEFLENTTLNDLGLEGSGQISFPHE